MTDRLAHGRHQTPAPNLTGQRQRHAQAVDTAVMAPTAPAADQRLVQLARALTELQPGIDATLQKRQRRIREAEAQQALRYVMDGTTPNEHDHSAFLLRTYRELSGKVNGLEQFDTELAEAYAEAGLDSADDPQRFRQFAQAFRANYLKAHADAHPDFIAGLTPVMEQSIQNLSARHAAVLSHTVSQGLVENFGNEMAALVRTAYHQGQTPQQIAATINTLNARNLPLLGGVRVNEIAIGVVAEAAQALGDPALLDTLSQVRGGSGVLAKTRAGLLATQRATEAIHSAALQRENLAWTQHTHRQQAAKEQAYGEINAAILDTGEVPLELLKKYHDIPGLTAQAFALKAAVSRDAERLSPAEIAAARVRLLTTPTMETVNQLIADGALLGASEVKEAVDLVQRVSTGPEARALVEGSAFRTAYQELTAVFSDEGVFRAEGLPALQTFRKELMQWAETDAGRAASPLQVQEQINGVRERILKAYQLWPAADAIPTATPPTASATSTASTPPPDPATPDILGGITSLDAFDRQLAAAGRGEHNALSHALAALRLDPPAARRLLTEQRQWLVQQDAQSAQDAAPSIERAPLAPTTGNTVGGTLGDLLDLIGAGESRGDYNIVWDGAAGTHADLTAMTVAEVLDYQRQRVNNGYASSAAGKYQFIRGTLDELVTRHDIPRTARFSPGLQDALAVLLMAEVGLDRYLTGDLPPEHFARRLSTQWAALPKDASGAGSHDGTAGNRATVSWHDVLSRVNALRLY